MKNYFWRLLTKNMELPTERAFWLVIGEAINFKWLIIFILFINVLAALLEGVSVAAMAFGVSAIVSPNEISCSVLLPQLEKIGLGGFCNTISKYSLFLWCLGVAFVGQIVRAGLQSIAIIFVANLQTKVIGVLQKKVVTQLMSLSYEDKNLYSAGEQQVYISQAAVTASLVKVLNTLVMNLFVFIFYLFILVNLSWKLSLGAFGLVIIFLLLVFTLG